MNDKYNTPNSGCCGRPMNYATTPKCGQNHCCFNEYNYKMNACIRKRQPDCSAQAVIPAITLENAFGLTSYANCFVHILSNNTTYYVDDKGTPIITWQGPVEVQLPEDVQTEEQWIDFIKSFKLKGQFLYLKFHNQEFDNDLIDSFYFSNSGKIYFAGEFEDTGIGG